jgi:hypothetical protein
MMAFPVLSQFAMIPDAPGKAKHRCLTTMLVLLFSQFLVSRPVTGTISGEAPGLAVIWFPLILSTANFIAAGLRPELWHALVWAILVNR